MRWFVVAFVRESVWALLPATIPPGPRPPRQVTTRLECCCPRKKILSFRCGTDGQGKGKAKRDLTCRSVCGQTLGCRRQCCAAFRHDDSALCAVRESIRCWRGKEKKVGSGVVWASQSIVSLKGRVRSGGLSATSVLGFLTAASPHMRETMPSFFSSTIRMLTLHLMLPTVLVRRAPSHRLPTLRDLSIHSPPLRSHPHLHLPLFESPRRALIHAKRNTPLGLATMHNRNHAPMQMWKNDAQSSLPPNPEQRSY